jgi:hypothetical protein
MYRLCSIRNGIQRCPPIKENLRWKRSHSISKFHQHNIKEGAVDCTVHYVIGRSFAFSGLLSVPMTSYNIDCVLGSRCYIRPCSIWIAWQRSSPMKGELRWRGPSSISKFHHHNLNGGAVDCTLYVTGRSFAFSGLLLSVPMSMGTTDQLPGLTGLLLVSLAVAPSPATDR